MHSLAAAARAEMIIILAGLMVVVVYKLFTGGINLSGLLTSKAGQANFSPGRAQMLMATLLTAMYYLIQVIENPSNNSLPPLPGTLVGVVGGSHLIYLGGKAWTHLFSKPGPNQSR